MAASDASATLDTILSQATKLAQSLNEAGRKKLIDGFRDLANSLEDTQDSIQRLLYCGYPLTALRIGTDLKLFNYLEDAGNSLSVDELAGKTGAAPLLLGRLLRYMSSVGLVKETAKDTFTGNSITKIFSQPGFQGGVIHTYDYAGPGIQNLPKFLEKRGYNDPTDPADTSLLEAWGSPSIPVFAHYPTQPALFGHFQQWMMVQRAGMPTWLDAYPYKEAAKSVGSPDQVFFVDVGGGFGHQTLAVREALPDLPNKFILQDLPEVLAMPPTIKHHGIESLMIDFWKPQPVKGARIYYLRNIIHDYPDHRAVEILKNIKAALGPDSVILLDEMFLQDTGVHWQAAQLDITMLSGLAAIERNEAQWRVLTAAAGLKIQQVYIYTTSLRDAIIECVPA